MTSCTSHSWDTPVRLAPVVLEGHGIRLEPLDPAHTEGLQAAVRDGRLWELWFTAIPEPQEMAEYIAAANQGLAEGLMLPWAVREQRTQQLIGSTRFHDVVSSIGRVEIGYTWYAASWQRTHVNTACKLLLLTHAFDGLGCSVVGLQTDFFNVRSQRAIEALGARRDGVIRHNRPRKDGSARDSVFYSILATEWPDVRRHLSLRLAAKMS